MWRCVGWQNAFFQRRKFGSNKTDSEFCPVVIPPISEFEDCGFESCQAGRIFKYDVLTIKIFSDWTKFCQPIFEYLLEEY